MRDQQRNLQVIHPSKQLEVRYRKELDALLRHMLEIVLSELRDTKINDALPDYFKWLTSKMTIISEKLDSIDLPSISKSIARRIVGSADKTNATRFDKQASKSFGIDLQGALTSSGQTVRDQLDIDREISANLITNMATDFKQRIGTTIMTNVQMGERSTNLITQIKEDYHVSNNRAKLIARDQASKINASLVQRRAEALGSKTYIWKGVLDERERTSHMVMQDMLCKWSDPTVYSDDNGKTWKKRKSIGGVELHPAGDYNCRCNARAVIEF